MEKQTAICIDDDPISRFIFIKFLSKLNCEIFEADGCYTGLELIKNHPEVEYVFLDLHMPVYDGYDFLQIIRGEPQFGQLKVVITSSFFEEQFQSKVKELGIDTKQIIAYLEKPLDLNKIRDILKR